ncbi:hypothetical protein ACFLRC_03885 [Candidatus Altiarchaeota archaeon]
MVNRLPDIDDRLKFLLQLDQTQLSTLLYSLLDAMDYEVKASSSHGHNLLLEAVKEDEFHQNELALYVFRGNRKVGLNPVKEVLSEKKFQGKKSIVLSLPGFTFGKDSRNLPGDTRLIDLEEFMDLLEKYGVKISVGERHTLVEKAFQSSMSKKLARESFRTRQSKKFLNIFGSEERLVEVREGYTPAGFFQLSRSDLIKVKKLVSSTKKRVMRENVLCVNLNTAEIYFIESHGLKREKKVVSSNVLNQLLDLNPAALEILADIVRNDEISLTELSRKHYLFQEEQLNNLLILSSKGLIDVKPGPIEGYITNIDLPSFDSVRFNLENYLALQESVEITGDPDPVVHEPNKISKLLGGLYSSTSTFQGVTYLPYYEASFIDDRNRSRKEIMLCPRFQG